MRALVVGTGSIAKRHLANLQSHPSVSATVMVRSSTPGSEAPHHQSDTVLASIDQAMAWGPDRVIVASPAPFHLQHAQLFAQAGVPLLIEKPLSDTWEQCDAHQPWLLQHRHLISVGYNLRYLPSAVFLSSYLHQGQLTGISSISIEVGQYLPDWRPGSDYREQVSARKALGGGAILELSHELDLLIWLFGWPAGVFCRARQTGQLDIDVEDTVDAIFALENGVTASLHMDFLQRAVTRKIKIVSAMGNLVWNIVEDTVELVTGTGSVQLFNPPHRDRNHSYREEMNDFISEGRCAASVSDALSVMKLVTAMKHSSENACFVPFGGQHG